MRPAANDKLSFIPQMSHTQLKYLNYVYLKIHLLCSEQDLKMHAKYEGEWVDQLLS